MNQYSKEQIQSDISELCGRSIESTEKSFELSRKKATEILMFLLSTSDREKKFNWYRTYTNCICNERFFIIHFGYEEFDRKSMR